VVLHGDNHAVHAHAHLLGGAGDDPQVRLMRHDPGDIVGGQPRLPQRGFGGFRKLFNGMAENLLALHLQYTRRPAGGDAAIDIEQIAVAPVGIEVGGEDAAVGGRAVAFLGLEDQRAGPVAETGRRSRGRSSP
jgi:hypothetical protein